MEAPLLEAKDASCYGGPRSRRNCGVIPCSCQPLRCACTGIRSAALGLELRVSKALTPRFMDFRSRCWALRATLLVVLAMLGRRVLTVYFADFGFAYALFLTDAEAHILHVWCVYSVASLLHQSLPQRSLAFGVLIFDYNPEAKTPAGTDSEYRSKAEFCAHLDDRVGGDDDPDACTLRWTTPRASCGRKKDADAWCRQRSRPKRIYR